MREERQGEGAKGTPGHQGRNPRLTFTAADGATAAAAAAATTAAAAATTAAAATGTRLNTIRAAPAAPVSRTTATVTAAVAAAIIANTEAVSLPSLGCLSHHHRSHRRSYSR
ncbi:unnamed protein product [Closterium sp. NIES-53]